ncbi:molybdopterin-dependent oxidoreductase [Granulicella arctica]|uniref:molybdopterin-dependent oxidoreductase n=1 Tax=Granulicella arctica TaxID=940613 RepID=UPI0021DF69E8|nr:molybdopterin-dependent oxidoreductase [Granulicella arctica]
MPNPRLIRTLLVAAMAIPACISTHLAGQTGGMETHQHAKADPSTVLSITEPDGKTLTLSPADFKAMPHKTVTVQNEHTKTSETYTGVPLTDLLTRVNIPVGKDLHGPAFVLYILAEGTDHYRVLYSLSEVDAVDHTGDVIVADTLNGAPLTTDGAFKLVSSEDKRPARWVRNLTAITVKSADSTGESHH